MESTKSKVIYSHILNIRIDDINFGNHLCHTRFINFLHNTRALFLKRFGHSESNCFRAGLVLLNLQIDYLSQCYFDEQLEICMTADAIEKASVTFGYTIHNITKNKIAAKAHTKMGFIDLEKGKLTRTPTEFKILISNI